MVFRCDLEHQAKAWIEKKRTGHQSDPGPLGGVSIDALTECLRQGKF